MTPPIAWLRGHLAIDDAAGVLGADEAVQAYQPELGVYADLCEYRGEAENRL